jgi:hypothetical protein
LILGLCAAAGRIAYQKQHAPYDDSFIYARTVRNVLTEGVWSFNPSSRLDICTSPLHFALLLAASVVAGGNILGSMTFLYGAALAVGAVLLFVLLRSELGVASAGIAAIAFIHYRYVVELVAGETLLLLALFLGVLLAWRSGRETLTAILASLTVLARPDSIVPLAVLALGYLAANRGARGLPAPRLVVAFLTLPLIWCMVHWSYFGTVLPYSLEVKTAQARSGVWVLFQHGFVQTFTWGRDDLGRMALAVAFALAWLGLVRAMWTRNRLATSVGLGAIAHFLAYTVLRVPNYHWYYGFQFLAIFWLAVTALSPPSLLETRAPLVVWRAARGVSVLGVALLALLTIEPGIAYARFPRNENGYRSISRQLRGVLPPGADLLTVEIGTLGWYLPDHVVHDTVGLTGFISPEDLARAKFGAWLENDARLPGYVLVLDRHRSLLLGKDAAAIDKFDRTYAPVRRLTPANKQFLATLYRRVEPLSADVELLASSEHP